jgi:phosphoribosylamine--glycine ligase
MQATVSGELADLQLEWDARSSACVVLAAEGYPGSYGKGVPIEGLEGLREWPNGMVFHAGTARQNRQIVTNGGRVLGVTGLGNDIQAAVREAYGAVERIHWDGMHFRRDIGFRAMERNR